MVRDIFDDGYWHSMAKRPRWKLADALPLINQLADLLKPEGWGVMLYGSVLQKGEGRDLDLMLLPAHPDAMNMYDVALIIPNVGLSAVRFPGYGHRRELGVVNWGWEDESERLVDMAFWPLPSRPALTQHQVRAEAVPR